jgi:DNA-binding MarR family transcriptional regulator
MLGLNPPKAVEELVREQHHDVGEREATIIALCKVLDDFRSVNQTMPVSQILAFLLVSLDCNLGMSEISEALNIKNSTASRYLLELGPKRLEGDGSLSLIARGVDPQNTRKARYTLTSRGRRLIEDVLTHLSERKQS